SQPKSAVPGLLPCCRSRLLAIDILEARSFATQTAQVVQLGAANLGRANQFDSVDYPRVLGENSFHPLPETDLAHGEAGLWSAGTGYHHAFERLQPLFVTFLDPYLHAHSIAGHEWWQVSALLLGQKFFDD